ncbi:MAG: BrnA antitoxin family protein [Sphingomonas sp.]|nr:BrnA antitoxin family protein [Sphingomonas sp.]
MSENKAGLASGWVDPDDAPEWTQEMFDSAEVRVGDQVIRPGAWRTAGRPPIRGVAKQQVTLRVDPDVIAKFREGGPGWQGRMNEALRKAVGL